VHCRHLFGSTFFPRLSALRYNKLAQRDVQRWWHSWVWQRMQVSSNLVKELAVVESMRQTNQRLCWPLFVSHDLPHCTPPVYVDCWYVVRSPSSRNTSGWVILWAAVLGFWAACTSPCWQPSVHIDDIRWGVITGQWPMACQLCVVWRWVVVCSS